MLRLNDNGQAMLEYVLLNVLVVIAGTGIAVFSWTNWLGGIQGYLQDILANVTLPIP